MSDSDTLNAVAARLADVRDILTLLGNKPSSLRHVRLAIAYLGEATPTRLTAEDRADREAMEGKE